MDYLCEVEYKYIVTEGTAGVVGCRCVPLRGAGGGVKIEGVQVSDNNMCMSRRWRSGGVALCVVEGMRLLAAAVGWRMSSWYGDTGVLLCWPVYFLQPFISQTLRDGTPQVLMLYRQIIAVCSEIHTKHPHIRCGGRTRNNATLKLRL